MSNAIARSLSPKPRNNTAGRRLRQATVIESTTGTISADCNGWEVVVAWRVGIEVTRAGIRASGMHRSAGCSKWHDVRARRANAYVVDILVRWEPWQR